MWFSYFLTILISFTSVEIPTCYVIVYVICLRRDFRRDLRRVFRRDLRRDFTVTSLNSSEQVFFSPFFKPCMYPQTWNKISYLRIHDPTCLTVHQNRGHEGHPFLNQTRRPLPPLSPAVNYCTLWAMIRVNCHHHHHHHHNHKKRQNYTLREQKRMVFDIFINCWKKVSNIQQYVFDQNIKYEIWKLKF